VNNDGLPVTEHAIEPLSLTWPINTSYSSQPMKNIIYILVIAFFISGCDSKRFLEKIRLEEEITKITNVIQIRNEIAYLPNENKPFTGKYEEFYSNGKKKSEVNYKEGKFNGLKTGWYENGQKKYTANFKDGKKNGFSTAWYENGQKSGEANYKDGKENGLWIIWYKNGQTRAKTTYKDGKLNGLSTGWNKNGKKKYEKNYIDGNISE